MDVAESGYQTWSRGKVITARRLEDARLASTQAGVRSFIITFDVYVILDIFEKYDNKRPDPICL